MGDASSRNDFVQPFQVEAPGLRGRLVRLGPVVEAVVGRHDYPSPVARLLAEALALGTVLASGLKYAGVFSLQMQGDGPVSLVVVDITSEGDIRGYARFRPQPAASEVYAGDPSVPRLLGAGHMAFTVDQGPSQERYQGITPIEGADLSECAHTFFRQSEQIDTAIHVCSQAEGSGAGGPRAAALMIQRTPGAGPKVQADEAQADEDWRRAVVLMSSVRSQELLSDALGPADVLFRLFHEEGVRLFRQRPLRHRCRCSAEKVTRTLSAFPPTEVRAMAEEGRIDVTCEFCKTTYRVDAETLEATIY
jgi:molecular chaperone Hsp33